MFANLTTIPAQLAGLQAACDAYNATLQSTKDADGNETVGIRSMVYLALSYDHRLVDGADAARFLQTMKARLEEAAFESELGL